MTDDGSVSGLGVKAEEEVVAILLGLVRCFGRKVRVGCGVAVSRMDEVTNVRLGAAMKSIQLLKALLSIYKNWMSMRTSKSTTSRMN
jgi:hypothetical protein